MLILKMFLLYSPDFQDLQLDVLSRSFRYVNDSLMQQNRLIISIAHQL